ncbi:MAG: hypothetical protein ABJ308_11770 [Halieaceae bacterium]
MNKLALLALGLSMGMSNASLSEQSQPRWMSPEAGWIHEETDTRVEKVTRDPKTGKYKVEISVPKVDKPIEEVLVVGQRDEKPEVEMPVLDYTVINDLDTGRSGIILYMGEKRDFALRINYAEGIEKGVAKDPGLTTR